MHYRNWEVVLMNQTSIERDGVGRRTECKFGILWGKALADTVQLYDLGEHCRMEGR